MYVCPDRHGIGLGVTVRVKMQIPKQNKTKKNENNLKLTNIRVMISNYTNMDINEIVKC